MRLKPPSLVLLAVLNLLGTLAGSCSTDQLPCAADGVMYCVSPAQYGLCNRGCMIPQPVAPGTHCRGNFNKCYDHIFFILNAYLIMHSVNRTEYNF
jgi:hypothetical protein